MKCGFSSLSKYKDNVLLEDKLINFLRKTTNMFETKNNEYHHLRNMTDFCLQKPKTNLLKKVLVMRMLKSGTICLTNLNKVIYLYQDLKLCRSDISKHLANCHQH